MSDSALGLLPDFIAGAVVVGEPVVVVAVLVGVEEFFRVLGGKPAREADGAIGAVGSVSPLTVRAVGGEDALALDRNIGGHAQHDGEAHGRAQHGIGDAGVAAGGVEEMLGWFSRGRRRA